MSPPQRRRLLVVLHDENLNGASIAILRLVEPLRALGWEVAFWAPSPGEALSWLLDRGYDATGMRKPVTSSLVAMRQPPGVVRRLVKTPTYLRAFARRVRTFSPDLVHANSLYSFSEALVGRTLRVPTLMHLHDMAPSSWKAEPVRQMTRRALSECVAVSHACATSYATGGWTPQVVYGAAPPAAYEAAIRDRPNPFVVGTVGVVSRRKGSDLFVAAAERLRSTHPEIEFRMIGSPTDPLDKTWGETVIQRAKATGVLYSPKADVQREIATWDAFVLPSRRDPFPLVTLEAMATGLPVIGSLVDGIPEQLAEGAGLLISAEDAGALATAIASLASAPREARATMSAAAKARAGRLFTIERQAKEMDELYRTVSA